MPASVATARARAREYFASIGVAGSDAHDALVVLTELLTNAIRHGSRSGDDVTIACALHGHILKVAVADAARGRTIPVQLTPSSDRVGGAGLALVAALAESWDDRIVGGRRVVTATVRSRENSRPSASEGLMTGADAGFRIGAYDEGAPG